jgi:hypothetical protein
MKRLSQIIDTTFLFLVIVCPPASGQMAGYLSKTANPASADNVSIVQLIANPERYDGKRIQLIGFVRIEFEGTAVYLHREDYERGIEKNALWINIPTGMSKAQSDAVNGQYVICLGTFDAAHHGHMGLFSGEIKSVERIQLWPNHAVLDGMVSGHEQPRK